MIPLERVGSCPHCRSTAFQPDVPCEDRLYGLVHGLEYARCQGCGVLFLSTRVVETELGRLYPESYRPYQDAGTTGGTEPSTRPGLPARAVQGVIHRLVPDPLPRLLQTFYTPPRPAARLVDFGCGSPAFLNRAAADGWAPVGVDFSPAVVDTVRAAGHEAHLVEECWAHLKPGSVDLLRMNHVLEHLYDPWETMRRVYDVVAPGGRLHVALPNPSGASARIFGRDFWSFEPRHAVLYPPPQAKTVLVELGFREVRVVHETLSKDMVRSWGYRRARRGNMPIQSVEGLAFRPWLGTLLLLPVKLAAALGRGDRFHLFATR